jgi:hypothetical protein
VQPVHLWPVRCAHSGLPKSPRNASRTRATSSGAASSTGLPAQPHSTVRNFSAVRGGPGRASFATWLGAGQGPLLHPLRLHLTTSVPVTAAEHSARNRPCGIGAYPKSIPVVYPLRGGLIAYSLVQQLGNHLVRPTPRHVGVLSFRYPSVAQVVGADPRRQTLVIDQGSHRLTEAVRGHVRHTEVCADLTPRAIRRPDDLTARPRARGSANAPRPGAAVRSRRSRGRAWRQRACPTGAAQFTPRYPVRSTTAVLAAFVFTDSNALLR